MVNSTSFLPAPTPGHLALNSAQIGQWRALLRYIAALGIVFAVACVYLWQAGSLADIRGRTAAVEAQIVRQERTNVGLMIQLAQWESPSHVLAEAEKAGLRPAPPTVYVVVPALTDARHETATRGNSGATVWQVLTGWLPGATSPGKAIAARP